MTDDELLAHLLREFRYEPETGKIFKRVGHPTGYGYQRVWVSNGTDNKPLQAHRAAWAIVHKKWPEYHIDHVNGDRSDNRLENLRDVPQNHNQQNERKARSNSKSGLLGASYSKSMKRWTARIHHDGKHHFLGYFDTAEDAHAAYLVAKRLRHPGCTI